jgi:tripartite-type tricarboxylate transporter receptor subunit TctC
MKQRWHFALAAVFIAGIWQQSVAFAQENFFQGKAVRIIVGAAAGGGYDTYSRTSARHRGK